VRIYPCEPIDKMSICLNGKLHIILGRKLIHDFLDVELTNKPAEN
jgi:hypothetical protein